MAFSQRARAYTLNPTLPCPTLPLSPRALSDSSIIPAAGRLCLKFKSETTRSCVALLTIKQELAGSSAHIPHGEGGVRCEAAPFYTLHHPVKLMLVIRNGKGRPEVGFGLM